MAGRSTKIYLFSFKAYNRAIDHSDDYILTDENFYNKE